MVKIVETEHICQFCVMDYVNKLISFEQAGVNLSEFETKELLFIIGDKITPENITHMKLAMEGMYK